MRGADIDIDILMLVVYLGNMGRTGETAMTMSIRK
jgi:hypothetical protein